MLQEITMTAVLAKKGITVRNHRQRTSPIRRLTESSVPSAYPGWSRRLPIPRARRIVSVNTGP